jgi:hypothetical protein
MHIIILSVEYTYHILYIFTYSSTQAEQDEIGMTSVYI